MIEEPAVVDAEIQASEDDHEHTSFNCDVCQDRYTWSGQDD